MDCASEIPSVGNTSRRGRGRGRGRKVSWSAQESTKASSSQPSSSSSSSSEIKSTDDPFHLNEFDRPSSLLVSTQLTGDNNYHEWCTSMMMALAAKNKLGLVNATITKPSPDDSSFSAWNQADQMVQTWLVNSLHEDLVLRNMNSDSAAQIWKTLADRFSPDEGLRMFNLHKVIADHKQGNDSVTIYFEKLTDIWHHIHSQALLLCNFDEKYFEIQKLMQFLGGLNEIYDSLRRKILVMNPLPAVDDAYALVLKEETVRGLSAMTISSSSTAGNSMNYAALVRCAQSSISSNTLIAPDKSTLHIHCAHCKSSDHTIDKCYKLHGYSHQRTLLNSNDLEEGEMEILHFSHEHPLKFSNELNPLKFSTGLKDSKELFCSGCSLVLVGPTYSCSQCSFTLHYFCSKLPRDMLHVAHGKHRLTLLLDTPNHNGEFVCCACGSVGKGFHFSCVSCQFFIDVHCASVPKSITHEVHLLSLKASSLGSNCKACGEAIEGVSYGCLDCSKKWGIYEFHAYCVTLPLTVKYKDHDHELSLHSFCDPFQDYGDGIPCKICWKDVYQYFWYYGCNVCHEIVAHTDCVASAYLHGSIDLFKTVKGVQITHRGQIELMKLNLMAGRIEECGQEKP